MIAFANSGLKVWLEAKEFKSLDLVQSFHCCFSRLAVQLSCDSPISVHRTSRVLSLTETHSIVSRKSQIYRAVSAFQAKENPTSQSKTQQTQKMAELKETSNVMPKLINFLASLLDRVSESNDLNPLESEKMSAFNGLSKPGISIQSYLERIFKYANCSPSCYIVAYVYLDRFTQCQPALQINSFSVHRLLITSVMVSAKFLDDMYYSNAYYAKVGGISTKEINFLEVDFLFGLRFHLNVSPTTFYTYCSHLQSEMMLQPQLNVAEESTLYNKNEESSNTKLHLYCNEAESSHQQHQLVV